MNELLLYSTCRVRRATHASTNEKSIAQATVRMHSHQSSLTAVLVEAARAINSKILWALLHARPLHAMEETNTYSTVNHSAPFRVNVAVDLVTGNTVLCDSRVVDIWHRWPLGVGVWPGGVLYSRVCHRVPINDFTV